MKSTPQAGAIAPQAPGAPLEPPRTAPQPPQDGTPGHPAGPLSARFVFARSRAGNAAVYGMRGRAYVGACNDLGTIRAPINLGDVDAFSQLVNDLSAGAITLPAYIRFIAALPGAVASLPGAEDAS